jgi:hypothetical protein
MFNSCVEKINVLYFFLSFFSSITMNRKECLALNQYIVVAPDRCMCWFLILIIYRRSNDSRTTSKHTQALDSSFLVSIDRNSASQRWCDCMYMNMLYVQSLNRIFDSCIAIRYIRSYILSRAVSSKQSSMDYLRLPYNCQFLVKYLTSLILTTYKCKISKLLISKWRPFHSFVLLYCQQ